MLESGLNACPQDSQDTKPPGQADRARMHHPGPDMSHLPTTTPRASAPLLPLPPTWWEQEQSKELFMFYRAWSLLMGGWRNRPSRTHEGQKEDKHSPSQFSSPPFPPPHGTTVHCFKTGLLIIHNTTNKPHFLCSLTKKYFHLKQIKSQNKTAKVTK